MKRQWMRNWARRGLWVLLIAMLASPVAAEPVAEVVRIKGGAIVRHAGAEIPLTTGAMIDSGDAVTTDGEARLELRFTDGAMLTLGGHVDMLVAEFLYTPDQGGREVQERGRGVLEMSGGAFAVATGALARLEGAPFTVKTPHASIGVRGTHFWGGPVETNDVPGGFGVLVLEGAVSVGNAAGTVQLVGAGAGTVIPSPDAPPDAPKRWSNERINRALSTVAFE